ncbi:DNA topoisomerase [Serendipita sp. 396]|nr:DNA topoisomerase [Serendipita sp. 396]KAG8787484.1 DNA topoisomerase [Serendipita sp. 397]KAG8824824.1 DNA topoisomerase [Serendipita sp. 401]KAG9056702.1 DNA topoisomerase [Serendipita sp. 407]
MRVLCVAEKPSIARSITDILSGGRYQTERNGKTSNFCFDYPRTNASFTVTYVAGHITELDFPETHRKWSSCDPFQLFDAPVEIKYPDRVKDLVRNIETRARAAEVLMIWTDCDREGEHIGFEIAQLCQKVNRRIRVQRARFSAIIPQQIHQAAQNPVELDLAQADAVYARQVLDLRLGAAFTRMQCLSLQNRCGNILENKLISYGPCQFPTLGFVVSRYEQVKSFVPEPFWYIFLALSRPGDEEGAERQTNFTWRRGHLFDLEIAVMLYEMVLEQPIATVTKVVKKNTKKWKPYPLTTVDLQKSGSRLLRMSAKQILDTADALYQRGILSYPRTETDQFDDQFDFASYIQKQTASPEWGAFATRLAAGGFNKPRKGKKNDKAHPPIHPTAYAGNLVGNEKKVYEYVTRRFLASCSKDAEGFQTTITVSVNTEEFSANGLLVLERNYLEVFPYDKWTSHELPNFEEGEEFMPTICELKEGQTTKPSLLTEADLVGLMDKNGIGTDATIAQHINTIVEREYVMERLEGKTKYLVPSTLGVGLVHGYNQIGLEKSLSKPQLRRETERSMVQVCERAKSKNDMLQESIDQYKEVFILVRREFGLVVESVRHYVQGLGQPRGNEDGNDGEGRRNARGRNPRPRGGAPDRNDGPSDSDDDFDNGPPGAPAAARAARAQNPAAPPRSESTTGSINCHCGVPAMQRTSGTEATKGRKFWRCGGGPNKDCEFFQWVDTPPSRPATATERVSKPATGRTNEATMKGVKRKQLDDNEETRQCHCKQDAVKRTVTKEGQNKGRIFWKCPNPEDSQCKFFEWGDKPAGGPQSSGAVFGESSRQNSAQTGECYKCGQTGHWSNACPTGVQSTNAKVGSSNNADTCYKCNKTGHWASNCPNPSSSAPSAVPNKKLRKAAGLDFDSPNTSSGQVGACFKCGQPGHFSNNCPSGPSFTSGRGRGRGRGRNVSGGKGGRGRGSAKGRGSKKGGSSFSAADDW